jgi:hypothetical protein
MKAIVGISGNLRANASRHHPAIEFLGVQPGKHGTAHDEYGQDK